MATQSAPVPMFHKVNNYVYDSMSDTWVPMSQPAATGSIAGTSNTQVLYNDGGIVGGDANFIWNKTTTTLTVSSASFSTATLQVTGVNTDFKLYAGPGDALNGGGSLNLYAGSGGDQYGGNLVLNAGSPDTGDGGGVYLNPGLGAGGGADGVIHLNDSLGGFIAIVSAAGISLNDGLAIQTYTTDAFTLKLKAYDVDGAAYKTFGTLTNGNTPNFTVAPPAGGTVTLQASTFKSSDGSTGISTTVTTASLVGKTITIKNGLITDFS